MIKERKKYSITVFEYYYLAHAERSVGRKKLPLAIIKLSYCVCLNIGLSVKYIRHFVIKKVPWRLELEAAVTSLRLM
jgi:hypothetical protein